MTQKVTLTYESSEPSNVKGFEVVDHRIIHEIIMDGVDWNQMIQNYINFLRGIGYIIPEDEDRV